MCGIAGWIDWERDLRGQKHILQAMANSLYRRGPDDEGFWLTKTAAFAFRRLIVVDPEGGKQPMIRKRGNNTYSIVYNGELYNTKEIRRELETLGNQFRSWSDTEVLLTAFMEWGPECVHKLNGIFAFAVWDEANQTLFMARDRLGVKPLFYTLREKSFIFASDLKTLLTHPFVEPAIDQEGLAEIFSIGPARTPGHGIFRHVQELKPGYSLIYDWKGIHTYPYWQLKSILHEDDLPTTVAKVRTLLQDAIQRQLVSDVPLCTLLSGGLDSSAISAVAAEIYHQQGMEPLHTYSVDYVDNDLHFQTNLFQPNPDAPWIKMMSSHLGSEHHDIRFDTPELIDSLTEAVRARDLPGMADVDGSLYLFSREIKKGATVALSGECADEVFGGYPWFHREEMINATTFPWSMMLDERINFLSQELCQSINPKEYVQRRYHEALDEVPALSGEDAVNKRMREMFYLNLTRWMPTLLDRKDRMSMAVGLEVRVPFCDHRLVEYLWNVPWEMKACDGREKGLLRRALHGILPEEIRTRKKSPYPKTHNPNYLTACRDIALERLHDSSSQLHMLFNKQKVEDMAEASKMKHIDLPWFGQLMNVPQFFAYMIQIDAWFREYHVRIT